MSEPICKVCGLEKEKSDAHFGISRPFGPTPHKFEPIAVPVNCHGVEFGHGWQKCKDEVTRRKRVYSQG